ncbi:MAG: DMT family transporter [Bacteriovorax sp.]
MFFYGFISILIFSLVPLAIKYTDATPTTICLFRLVVAVFALAIIWRKKIQFRNFFYFEKRSLKLWFLGLIFFFHWITYSYGVKLGGASIGVLGLSTYGIQLIIAGAFFLGHRITRKDVVCLMGSMVGIVMIIPSWNLKNDVTKGLLLALMSATCFAVLPIMHRKSQEFSEETRIFAQFFGAMIGFFLFIGKTHWALRMTDWSALIFLAVFGTLIAHSLWAKLSSALSPSTIGLVYYTIAPMTIIFSALLLGEKFTLVQMLGALIIILAAVFNIWKGKTLVR